MNALNEWIVNSEAVYQKTAHGHDIESYVMTVGAPLLALLLVAAVSLLVAAEHLVQPLSSSKTRR